MSSHLSRHSGHTGASRSSRLSESNVGRLNTGGSHAAPSVTRGPPPSRSAYYGESSHGFRASSMTPSRSGSQRSHAPSVSHSHAPTHIYAPSHAPSRSASRALGPPPSPSAGLVRSSSQSHVSGRSRVPSAAGTQLTERTVRPADSVSMVSSRRGSDMQSLAYPASSTSGRVRRSGSTVAPSSVASSHRTSGFGEAGRRMASRRQSAMDRDFERFNSGLEPSRPRGSVTVSVTVSQTISHTRDHGGGERIPTSHPRDFDDDFSRFSRY